MIATMPALDKVAQENEQNHDHQDHAFDQVVQHVVRRDLDQVGALIEDP